MLAPAQLPPSFLIIGSPKSASTSLYAYLITHPRILSAVRKETHFLDWLWSGKNRVPLSSSRRARGERLLQASGVALQGSEREALLYYLQMFSPKRLLADAKLISGEATSTYLYYGGVAAKRVATYAPHAVLFATIRAPVARAYSHYHMSADPVGSDEQKHRRGHSHVSGRTFEQCVDAELELLERFGITPNSSAEQFQHYLDHVNEHNSDHGGHSFVSFGLYVLQLRVWRANIDKPIHLIDTESLKTLPKCQRVLDCICDAISIERFQLQTLEILNSRKYPTIDPRIEQRLCEFYRPYNQELAREFAVDVSRW
jgi:hypothetical protein